MIRHTSKTTSKHFLAVIYLALIALSTFASAQNDLVISEYHHGVSNSKAIEFCNLGSTSINLTAEGYVWQTYRNGRPAVETSVFLSNVIVPAGAAYVLGDDQFDSSGSFAPANQTLTALDFNGNDALVLRKGGLTGPVVDSIGQVGIVPAGGNGPNFFSATTYRKTNCSATDTIPDDTFVPSLLYAQTSLSRDATNIGTCSNCLATSAPTGTPITASPNAASTAPTPSPTGSPLSVGGVVSPQIVSFLCSLWNCS